MAITHSTVVVVPDDGTSPVGTNEWNADHVLDAGTVLLPARVHAGGPQTYNEIITAYSATQLVGDILVQLSLFDTTPFAAGVGGVFNLGGKYDAAGSRTSFAAIQGAKDNATDGNYDGRLGLWTRTNGTIFRERLRVDPAGKVWLDPFGGLDTNLYRSAADTLKTDDALVVAGTIKQSTTKDVLDTDHTAAADPHTVYRLKSTAESNVYIQDPGTFTIPTDGRLTQPVRLALSSTERLTNAGTGRAVVSDAPYDPSALKYRSPGSVALTSDEYVTEYQRVELRGNSRKSMFGTGRAIITGFNPIGRLVLAGSGGGS